MWNKKVGKVTIHSANDIVLIRVTCLTKLLLKVRSMQIYSEYDSEYDSELTLRRLVITEAFGEYRWSEYQPDFHVRLFLPAFELKMLSVDEIHRYNVV